MYVHEGFNHVPAITSITIQKQEKDGRRIQRWKYTHFLLVQPQFEAGNNFNYFGHSKRGQVEVYYFKADLDLYFPYINLLFHSSFDIRTMFQKALEKFNI